MIKNFIITEAEKELLETLFSKLGVDIDGLLEIKNLPEIIKENEEMKLEIADLREKVASLSTLVENNTKVVLENSQAVNEFFNRVSANDWEGSE